MNQMIPYQQLAGTAPHWNRKHRKIRELKFWQSILFFVGIMIGFDVLVQILYLFIDNTEVVSLLDQIGFLAASVIFVKCMHADYREVFPIKKPTAEAVLGCLVVVIGAYLAINICSIITIYLIPDQYIWISQAMSSDESYSGLAQILVFLNWTLVPAICEESVHRGVILTGIRNKFHNKYLAAVIAGCIFGLFHIYPARWLATGFVGGLMAYAVLESGNIVYSCIIHFSYNSFLMIVDALTPSTSTSAAEFASAVYSIDLSTVGAYLIFYGWPIPFLLYLGFWLIRRATAPVVPAFLPRDKKKETLQKILVPTIGMIVLGILFLIFG